MSVMMLLLALEMSTLFILFHFSFALFCMSSWNNNSYFKIAGVIHIFLFKLVLSSILWNLCSFCFKRYRIAQNQNSILWWKLKYLYTIYNMINFVLPETFWWCFASLRCVNSNVPTSTNFDIWSMPLQEIFCRAIVQPNIGWFHWDVNIETT